MQCIQKVREYCFWTFSAIWEMPHLLYNIFWNFQQHAILTNFFEWDFFFSFFCEKWLKIFRFLRKMKVVMQLSYFSIRLYAELIFLYECKYLYSIKLWSGVLSKIFIQKYVSLPWMWLVQSSFLELGFVRTGCVVRTKQQWCYL